MTQLKQHAKFVIVLRKFIFKSSSNQARVSRESLGLSFLGVEFVFLCWCTVIAGTATAQANPKETLIEFNIPSQRADIALTEFAKQAGQSLVFPFASARGRTANSLTGRYSVLTGLEKLLSGTGLQIEIGDQGGFSVKTSTTQIGEGEPLNTKKNIATMLMGLFGAAGVAGPAVANDQETVSQLEEVVITAQKRSQSLQDVPIAVSAFSNENLERFGVVSMQGLQDITPGLVFSNTGPYSQPYIRGVGTRLAFNGLEPSIAVYVDDRYVSRSTAALFDFADVERIEILKGPQGTLYGRNATGGAIRMISMGVADELEGRIKTRIGNYDAYQISGTVSIPLTDTFGMRLSGLTNQRDGFANNLSPLGAAEVDDRDFNAFRAKARWDFSETASANLTLGYWEKDDFSGGDKVSLGPLQYHVAIAQGGITGTRPDQVATRLGATGGDEFTSDFRLEFSFDSIDLVSISTYTDYEMDVVNESDGTDAPSLDLLPSKETSEEFSQEIQLLSTHEGAMNWLLGTYYYQADSDLDFIIEVGAPFLVSQGLQNVETTAGAIFGQIGWELSDAWEISLGGRWSYEEKEVDAIPSPTGAVLIAQVPYTDEDSWSEFTPKATLTYHTDDAMFYLTYARGFKSGGFNYPAGGTQSLEPEILDMFELGVKGEFFNNRLRLNSSAYYYDYQDLQVSRTGESANIVTDNAADASVLGLDFDVTWLATDHLELKVGFNLLSSEYEEYPAAARSFVANVTGDLTQTGMANISFNADGESLLRAPDFSAFISAKYEIDLTNGGSVPFSLTYAYKDEYEFDFVADPDTSVLRQNSYGLLSARLAYVSPAEHLEVAFWGNNLTDEVFFDDVVGNARGLYGSWGVPRTYGIEASYRF